VRQGALLALVVALLVPALAAAGLEPGNHRVSLQHDGRPRAYIVHVPPAARDGQPLPVVLSFHGGGGNAENQQTAELKGQAGTKEAGHAATRYAWGPCRDGGEVVLWKLAGAGHVWPGGLPDYLPRLLGPSTSLVDANVEMWRFFQRFTVPLTR